MIAQQVGRIEQAQGDNLHPPEKIEASNILAHALDHLALLYCSDESIKAVLESGWLEALATRLPRPAGYLAHS